MKIKFLKQYNRLITFFLSVIGVGSACTFLGCEYGTPALEYGVPNATFNVYGTILSENDDKLEDIQVIMELDTSYSDMEGNYQVSVMQFPEKKTNLFLEFNDTGTTKAYRSLDTTVVFENPEYVNGDGSWYKGETSKKLDITLKKEEK